MTRTDLELELDDTLEDQRWRRLVDADAIDEASPEEAASVREHRGDGALSRRCPGDVVCARPLRCVVPSRPDRGPPLRAVCAAHANARTRTR